MRRDSRGALKFAAASVGIAALVVACPPAGLALGALSGFLAVRSVFRHCRADKAARERRAFVIWRGTQADLSHLSIEERNAYRRSAVEATRHRR